MGNPVTGSKPKERSQDDKNAVDPQLGNAKTKQEQANRAQEKDKSGPGQTITPKGGVKP